MPHSPSRRTWLATALAVMTVLTGRMTVSGPAQAQTTPIKFQLDWRFEGPAALFLAPAAKGYFKDAKLDVSIDAGNGYDYLLSKRSGFYAVAMSDKITGLSECSSYSVGVRHRFQAPQ